MAKRRNQDDQLFRNSVERRKPLESIFLSAVDMQDTNTKEAAIDRADWACANVRLEGNQFSFVRHEYLKEVYECDHPFIIIEKAAQTGGSVFCIVDCLWALDVRICSSIIYFFPTQYDVNDFSHGRVAPIIEANPKLKSKMRNIDNVKMKQFVDEGGGITGTLLFRGMKSKVSTSSTPADSIVIDERDKVSTQDYELAIKRISHSERGFQREACTPTVADYGIDATFLKSDQRYWWIKCNRCNEWNQVETTFREMGNPSKVLFERPDGTVYLGCKKCDGMLDMAKGQWIPTFSQRDRIVGFHFSQLWSQVVQSGISIQQKILEDFRTTRFMQDFWNSRIGFPYEDRNTMVTLEMLNACDGDYLIGEKGTGCTMGVDQGNILHYIVSSWRGNMRYILAVGIVDNFEALDELMIRYDIRTCVIDANPNQHPAKGFADKFPGRVWLCYYTNKVASLEPTWDSDKRQVTVDRTFELDSAIAAYVNGKVRIPRDPVVESKFKPQMCNMARKPKRDSNNEITGYEWIKRGADHFRHADVYDQLAGTKIARSMDEILSGVVLIRPGEGGRETITMATDAGGIGGGSRRDDPFSKIGDMKEMGKW